ncbi:hypothetical protein [Micromonospora sp. NPDC093277]|uniref:hypothetical protein n=1 Tax=Micromonospora sp. NPDC093277 TaxID=3364291 RepID=UPI00381C1EC3
MAFRTWSRLLLTALGVSMLAGAGQLGIAYGFGVVRLDGAFTDGAVNRWPAQLAWVGWFAAVAAVAGAVGTERLARRDGVLGGTTEQLSLAGAAALGAIVVAPLCMQPARTAELGGTVDPVWAVGICAILGALIGAGAAIVVLINPPFGWNIALTAAAVWLLALISAAPSVSSAGPLVTVRLGVLEPSWVDAETAQRLAMLLLPLVALLAGAAVGALARRRGHLPLVGGAAGAAGPVLLAFAYLTAGPGNAADRYQLAPYYAALIAVAAGALGSAATTVLRRPVTETGTAALEPTDILQPLPPSPATPGEPGRTAGPVPEARGTAGEPSRPRAAPEASPPGATAMVPAHWDWPAPSNLTPAPVPARQSRAVRAAPDHTAADARPTAAEPTSSAGPVFGAPAATERTSGGYAASGPASGERAAVAHARAEEPEPVARSATPAAPDAPASTAGAADVREPVAGRDTDKPVTGRETDELARNLSMRGLAPSGRRTSAIDVLAAGRPIPQPLAGPDGGTSAPASAAVPSPQPEGVASTMPASAARPAAERRSRRQSPSAPEPTSTDPRPEGRSKRGRKVHTSSAATMPPAEAAPAETTPVEPVPAQMTTARTVPAETHTKVPAVEAAERSALPAPRPAAAVRNEPAVPAPSQSHSPFGNTGAAGGTTSDPTGTPDRNGAPTAETRVEPAPHPRHRALPDLGREARWEAFANARRVSPVPNTPHAAGQHATPGEPVVADPAEEEPGNGKPKLRRGLFRRNRAKDDELDDAGRSDDGSEPLASQDEEYVDWVAGLASDADREGTRTLRTGRHHRD